MDLHPVSTVRDEELRAVLRLVESPATRSVAIRAPAGMGKSTLLAALTQHLADQGVTVRLVRPSEAEQHMPFTALVDLLAGLPDRWHNELPEPQRRAIRAALLLEEAHEEIDPRAVAAGLAGIVVRSGDQGPIVVVVDDAQWLDPASRTMIVAALRRLQSHEVTVVAASRPTEEAPDDWLPGPLEAVDLDPLGREHMHRLLRAHLEDNRGPALLRSVVERSGGNPLFALQLARDDGPDGRLDQLISRQVLRLPIEARLVMLTAALAVDRSVDTVAAALGLTPLAACAQVDPARTAGLVRVSDEFRFEHPLYAEAVVTLAAEPERRRALEGLAAAEPDRDARIAHTAALVVGPDAELADRLDEAASNARRRGAWDRSTELLGQAVAHTPPGPVHLSRRGRLGHWLVRGGRSAEGEAVLREVYEASTGPTRHRAALALAELYVSTGRPRLAGELTVELDRDGASPEIQARALIINPLVLGDRKRLARAERATKILTTAGSSPEVEQVRTAAMTLRARCLINAAEPADDLLGEAVAREGAAPSYAPLQSAAFLASSHAHWGDRYETAERGYRGLVERALDVGDEESLPTLLAFSADNHARHARWDAARRDIEAAHGGDPRQQVSATMFEVELAWIRGHTGDLDEALAVFERSRAVFDVLGLGLGMYHQSWLGELLLGAERYDDARRVLSAGIVERRRTDTLDPGVLPLDTDWVEAAIAVRDLDGAAHRLALVGERAERMGRANVLAACQRLRVLLQAVTGDVDGAVAAVPALLQAYEAADRRPLDRGRAHLTAGAVLRRARSRRKALEQLERARQVFAESGHETFRRRAERSIARIGERSPGPGQLTGAERRTAELAIDGLRNREIAAALFVDVKTVESTLTRVYRKLGIRSRVELARAVRAHASGDGTTEPAGT